jgi:NAD-specific glutamate dehydrogenase
MSTKHTPLDGGALRNSFSRVEVLRRLLVTEKVHEELLHLGDTGGTSNEDHLNLSERLSVRNNEGYEKTHVVT